MGGAMEHLEGDIQLQFLIAALQFVCLIDWHLRILIAVQQEQRWVVFIHVKHRAGELGQSLGFFRGISQQQLERRHADAEAVRGGLAEDTGQIAGAIVARDGLHVGRLFRVAAHRALERSHAVAGADQGRQMAAGGIARDADAIGVVAVFPGVRAQPANGAFAVVYQCWKFRHGTQAVINAGHGVAAFHQRRERHEIFAARAPCTAVYPYDEGRVLGRRQIEVQCQSVIIDLGVLQVRDL